MIPFRNVVSVARPERPERPERQAEGTKGLRTGGASLSSGATKAPIVQKTKH